MLTQVQTYELKRAVAELLDDTALPRDLQISRIVELLERHAIIKFAKVPAFDDEEVTKTSPPGRKSSSPTPARKKASSKKAAKKKTARTAGSTASA